MDVDETRRSLMKMTKLALTFLAEYDPFVMRPVALYANSKEAAPSKKGAKGLAVARIYFSSIH